MNDIIVVEGTHDEARIKLVYPNASCVVTNGLEISNDTLKLIKKLLQNLLIYNLMVIVLNILLIIVILTKIKVIRKKN